MTKSKAKIEFGDFQTPLELARQICKLLRLQIAPPKSILEPTCGTGAFLRAAVEYFPRAKAVSGCDLNAEYVAKAREVLPKHVQLKIADFFTVDWEDRIRALRDPVLVMGNPPWVTNSQLGVVGSSNLPAKSNHARYSGLDALTGKSNFDISEWMLTRILDALDGRHATLAMLCKTAIARKVLATCWQRNARIRAAKLYRIDAKEHFGATVEACLLFCELHPEAALVSKSERNGARPRCPHGERECDVFAALDAPAASHTFGWREDRLLADVQAFERHKHLQGNAERRWRSGIKHDCRKVMEFVRDGDQFINGFGERAKLEEDFLYPMLKSSELASGRAKAPTRWMLVTQRTVGDATEAIGDRAPHTWRYLNQHAARLDRRASSIYRNRPKFSVFGVGPYTFSPWKVAISGFYKGLGFSVVGRYSGKPIVLDDTSYFLACRTKREAQQLASALKSDTARQFFAAYIFWDAKRPITAAVLGMLDLDALVQAESRNTSKRIAVGAH